MELRLEIPGNLNAETGGSRGVCRTRQNIVFFGSSEAFEKRNTESDKRTKTMIILSILSGFLAILIIYSVIEQIFFPDWGLERREHFSAEEKALLVRLQKHTWILSALGTAIPLWLFLMDYTYSYWINIVEGRMGFVDTPALVVWSTLFLIPLVFFWAIALFHNKRRLSLLYKMGQDS